MKPDQERVQVLLADTVTLLCRNGLTFAKELKVQGLLAITLDTDDVFVVHINESFAGLAAAANENVARVIDSDTICGNENVSGNRGAHVPLRAVTVTHKQQNKSSNSLCRQTSSMTGNKYVDGNSVAGSSDLISCTDGGGTLCSLDRPDSAVSVKTELDEDLVLIESDPMLSNDGHSSAEVLTDSRESRLSHAHIKKRRRTHCMSVPPAQCSMIFNNSVNTTGIIPSVSSQSSPVSTFVSSNNILVKSEMTNDHRAPLVKPISQQFSGEFTELKDDSQIYIEGESVTDADFAAADYAAWDRSRRDAEDSEALHAGSSSDRHSYQTLDNNTGHETLNLKLDALEKKVETVISSMTSLISPTHLECLAQHVKTGINKQKVASNVRVAIHEGYESGEAKGLQWVFTDGNTHMKITTAVNNDMTSHVLKYVMGRHKDADPKLITVGIERYFQSQKVKEARKRTGKEDSFNTLMKLYQRKKRKLERRRRAAQSTTLWNAEKKKTILESLKLNYMSSEHEEDTDDERVLSVHPLTWRSDQYNQLMAELDDEADRMDTRRGRNQAFKRIRSKQFSTRMPPTDVPQNDSWIII